MLVSHGRVVACLSPEESRQRRAYEMRAYTALALVAGVGLVTLLHLADGPDARG